MDGFVGEISKYDGKRTLRRKNELTEVEGGQKNGKSEDHGNYVLEMEKYVRFFEYLTL